MSRYHRSAESGGLKFCLVPTIRKIDLASQGGTPTRPASFSESGSIPKAMRERLTNDAAPMALSADIGSRPLLAWCATTIPARHLVASETNPPIRRAAAELLFP